MARRSRIRVLQLPCLTEPTPKNAGAGRYRPRQPALPALIFIAQRKILFQSTRLQSLADVSCAVRYQRNSMNREMPTCCHSQLRSERPALLKEASSTATALAGGLRYRRTAPHEGGTNRSLAPIPSTDLARHQVLLPVLGPIKSSSLEQTRWPRPRYIAAMQHRRDSTRPPAAVSSMMEKPPGLM